MHNASKLRPINPSNEILKFADDTYIIVSAQGCHACHDELEHVRSWASDNNLTLNRAKSKEIIFRARGVRGATSQLPNPIDGNERVDKITALGIIVNDQLTSTDHVSSLLASCSSLLYAPVVKLLNRRWWIPVSRRNSNMTGGMYRCVSVIGTFLRVHTHNTSFFKVA